MLQFVKLGKSIWVFIVLFFNFSIDLRNFQNKTLEKRAETAESGTAGPQ